MYKKDGAYKFIFTLNYEYLINSFLCIFYSTEFMYVYYFHQIQISLFHNFII